MTNSVLDGVLVRLSDTRQVSLSILLDAWIQHVDRIRTEIDIEVLDYAWTPHDLVAALVLRDRIFDALRESPRLTEIANTAVLAKADQLFKDISVDDPEGFVVNFAMKSPRVSWWWTRLPSRGPIRDELIAFGSAKDFGEA